MPMLVRDGQRRIAVAEADRTGQRRARRRERHQSEQRFTHIIVARLKRSRYSNFLVLRWNAAP